MGMLRLSLTAVNGRKSKLHVGAAAAFANARKQRNQLISKVQVTY